MFLFAGKEHSMQFSDLWLWQKDLLVSSGNCPQVSFQALITLIPFPFPFPFVKLGSHLSRNPNWILSRCQKLHCFLTDYWPFIHSLLQVFCIFLKMWRNGLPRGTCNVLNYGTINHEPYTWNFLCRLSFLIIVLINCWLSFVKQMQTSADTHPLSGWECSGYFLFKSRNNFDQATEEAILERLGTISLDEQGFQVVKQLCCSIASKLASWTGLFSLDGWMMHITWHLCHFIMLVLVCPETW